MKKILLFLIFATFSLFFYKESFASTFDEDEPIQDSVNNTSATSNQNRFCLPNEYSYYAGDPINRNPSLFSCLPKIENSQNCGNIGSVTPLSKHETCLSGYCNLSQNKCEEDPNCTGVGRYKLTSGVPFLGFNQGACVNTDTAMSTFLSNLIKFILGSVGTVTTIIIIIAGFMRAFSAGNPGTISKSNGMIKDAIIGLVLTLTVGLMLQIVNPELVNFTSLFSKFNIEKVNINQVVREPTANERNSIRNVTANCSRNVPSYKQTNYSAPSCERGSASCNSLNSNPNYYNGCSGGRECLESCYHPVGTGSNVKFYRDSIAWAGCGPTSAAMVLSYLGKNINVIDAIRFSENNYYNNCDSGTEDTFFNAIATANNLKFIKFNDINTLKNSLSNGPVIALMWSMERKPGCKEFFAPSGHYIVVNCYDQTNNSVKINDPFYDNRTSADIDSLDDCAAGYYYMYK